jgi:serine/threonine protein kinase
MRNADSTARSRASAVTASESAPPSRLFRHHDTIIWNSMPLNTGTPLGPYEIVAPLGAGGMGEVYRAHDSRLGRDVALKVLPDGVAGDPARQQRFEMEARAVAALNHPNIVAIFDVALQEQPAFIVSELVSGETLRGVIQRGPVPLKKVLDIAVQIADGLAAAHAAGIAHRDLKPENIMLTPEGRAKILDFGLAKSISRAVGHVDATRTIAATEPGTIVGTASYMSPEQASGSPEVDGRSDQFSLGLIIQELITGSKAFERPTAAETMAAIIREDPAALPATVPLPLRWSLERCLAKEPGQRYDTTRDLFLELRQLRDHASEISAAAIALRRVRRFHPNPTAPALGRTGAGCRPGDWLRDRRTVAGSSARHGALHSVRHRSRHSNHARMVARRRPDRVFRRSGRNLSDFHP